MQVACDANEESVAAPDIAAASNDTAADLMSQQPMDMNVCNVRHFFALEIPQLVRMISHRVTYIPLQTCTGYRIQRQYKKGKTARRAYSINLSL